jgi:hypothetical protein
MAKCLFHIRDDVLHVLHVLKPHGQAKKAAVKHFRVKMLPLVSFCLAFSFLLNKSGYALILPHLSLK